MSATAKNYDSVISSFIHRMGVCLRADIIVATITINLLSLALPIVILQLYDRIIPNQATETLGSLVVGLVLVVILDTILRIARVTIMNKLGAEFEHNATLKLLNVIIHSDLSEFESRRNSDYLEKIKAIENVRDIQFGQSILSLLDLPFISMFLFMIWFFTGWLVLVPIVMFVIFMTTSILISRSLYSALTDRDTVFEKRHNFLLEVLQGIQTLKPLAMEEQMMRRYERLQSKSAQTIYKLAHVNNLIQSSTSTLSQFTMVAFVAVGAAFAVSGGLSVGALAAGSMLAGRILQPASRALNFWMQWQTGKVAEEKIVSILGLHQEESDEQEHQKIVLDGSFSLKDVTFQSNNTQKPLLDKINMSINPNDFVAIIGNNGSGKTTIIKLLLGLLKPEQGEITYNGIALNKLDMGHFRQQIGLVPQRGALFTGSFLENLTSFRHGDAVNQALGYVKNLGLDDVIMRMRDGLATQLDSTLIDNIPEGLRQRIVMVRALVGDPKIILFDDANAGYDPKNSQKLIEFFSSIKGKKTIVVITNQDQLIALSDRCLKLSNGQLTEIYSRIDRDTKKEKSVNVIESGSTISGGKSHG